MLRVFLFASLTSLALASGTVAQAPLSSAPVWYAPTHTAPSYDAPYAGQVNHAHSAPQYRWGWFGAEHFYPTTTQHRGYYGDWVRWSRYRRY